MKASLSGNLATMCPGMPYTIAAKFAYPDRVPIGLIGDGAMQMLGLNGLITVSKYWKTWSNPQFVILVLKQPRFKPGNLGTKSNGRRPKICRLAGCA